MWENATDLMHFPVIHRPGVWAGSDVDKLNLENPAAYHVWEADWKPAEPPNGHIAVLKIKEKVMVFGIKMPLADINVLVHQVSE